MDDLAARLAGIEARFAVADLIHAYARHIRCDEPDQVSRLFLADGTFEIRDGHPDRAEYSVRARYDGRDAVHAHLAPNKGQPHPVPLIRNLIIAVDGDRATANSVMDAAVYGTDIRVQGEYHDACRCVDGRWYFASRNYTIFRGASAV